MSLKMATENEVKKKNNFWPTRMPSFSCSRFVPRFPGDGEFIKIIWATLNM